MSRFVVLATSLAALLATTCTYLGYISGVHHSPDTHEPPSNIQYCVVFCNVLVHNLDPEGANILT